MLRDHKWPIRSARPMISPSVLTGDMRCNDTSLGLLHIGGYAHFVWAYPPNCGRTAQRHVQVHRRTTVEYLTVADAMIETQFRLRQIVPREPTWAQNTCFGGDVPH